MNPRLKLYIKYIYNSLKAPSKYFGIWLLTGTWLPWLANTYLFRESSVAKKDAVLLIIEGFLLFLFSIVSVMISLGVIFGIGAIFLSLRDYFKRLSYKVESDLYVNSGRTANGQDFAQPKRKRRKNKPRTKQVVPVPEPVKESEPKPINRLDTVL